MNPSTRFGGTWVRIPNGYLRNNGNGTPLNTGGSMNTGGHGVTTAQMPVHNHRVESRVNANGTTNGSAFGIAQESNPAGHLFFNLALNTTRSILNSIPIQQSVGALNTGGGQAHTHTIEPSFVNVFAWRRTA